MLKPGRSSNFNKILDNPVHMAYTVLVKRKRIAELWMIIENNCRLTWPIKNQNGQKNWTVQAKSWQWYSIVTVSSCLIIRIVRIDSLKQKIYTGLDSFDYLSMEKHYNPLIESDYLNYPAVYARRFVIEECLVNKNVMLNTKFSH